VLASGCLGREDRERLKHTYTYLNPVKLRAQIEQALQELWDLADNAGRLIPHFYSRSAGPDLISRSGKSERGFVVVPDNRALAS